jgi:hypothetical protein
VQMWAGALFFRSRTLRPEPEWSVCPNGSALTLVATRRIAAAHGHAALQREPTRCSGLRHDHAHFTRTWVPVSLARL